jgi:hypothetical protein
LLGRKNAFELVRLDHKKKKYIICTKEPEDKRIWMNEISNLVNGYLQEEMKGRFTDRVESTGDDKSSLIQQIRTISEHLETLQKQEVSADEWSEQQRKIKEETEKLAALKKQMGFDVESQFEKRSLLKSSMPGEFPPLADDSSEASSSSSTSHTTETEKVSS